MAVAFHRSKSYDPADCCCICLERLGRVAVVAHDDPLVPVDDPADLHPAHRECMAEWIQRHPVCPLCKAPVIASSILSWKERIASHISSCKESALEKIKEVAGPVISVTATGLGIVLGGCVVAVGQAMAAKTGRIISGFAAGVIAGFLSGPMLAQREESAMIAQTIGQIAMGIMIGVEFITIRTIHQDLCV